MPSTRVQVRKRGYAQAALESTLVSLTEPSTAAGVACELDAPLCLRGETIVLADVCEVAHAVAAWLGREFWIEYARLSEGSLPDEDLFGPDGADFYG